MDLDMSMIGSRIKKRRKELSLTQTDIKEKTGISSGNMSDIERGNRLPAAATLILLSEALQCSIDYLLTGKTPYQEITGQDLDFLNILHEISKDDQEELFLIAKLKQQRQQRKKTDLFFIPPQKPEDT